MPDNSPMLELYLLPVSVNIGLGWTGTSSPFLCLCGGDSLCAFQLLHEVPFPAPKFFRLPQELDSSGLGVIFRCAFWDFQTSPELHEEKVGGCRGCILYTDIPQA
jgi:hypothetical protein